MPRTRFLMVGGFLGAGKTTAIARLARHYTAQGLKVGLVTNDQAYDLVDTHTLRAQGFHVGEVPGACFCCKFDDLVDTAGELTAAERPDLIITEPVGSCTDLVATVVEPLRHLHGDDYDVAPYVVLCKPEHGRKILGGEDQIGFSPKAAYIFIKQLEEADVIVVNKVDTLTGDERQPLIELVQGRFADKPVLAMSARTGEGFEELLAAVEEQAVAHERFMEVDYDVYADGEAELGWLNCTVRLETSNRDASQEDFMLDEIVLGLVEMTDEALKEAEFEPAHLKVLGMADGATSIANLVSSETPAELSLAAELRVAAADLIVNARVGGDPDQLANLVIQQAADLAVRYGLEHQVTGLQHFRPGRPVPTHRMTSAP